MVAKYDWDKLKREYILGDYKSISEFAKAKGITRNGSFNKMTTGWANEKAKQKAKKSKEIIEKTVSKEIEYEVDRNAAHLQAGDAIMVKLFQAIEKIKINGQALALLKDAATVLDKIQKSQRLGEGMDSADYGNDSESGVVFLNDIDEVEDDA